MKAAMMSLFSAIVISIGYAAGVLELTFKLHQDAALPLKWPIEAPSPLIFVKLTPNLTEVAQVVTPNCSGDAGHDYGNRVDIKSRDGGCYLVLKGLSFQDGGDYELREASYSSSSKSVSGSQIKLRITDDPPKSSQAPGGPSKLLLLLCFLFTMLLLL